MNISLKQRIINYFKRNPDEWIQKGIIADLARQHFYSAENAGRRCRELKEDGDLIEELRKGQRGEMLAHYKLNPNKYKVEVYKVADRDIIVKQATLI